MERDFDVDDVEEAAEMSSFTSTPQPSSITSATQATSTVATTATTAATTATTPSPPPPPLSTTVLHFQARANFFKEKLSESTLSKATLAQLCFEGIPETAGLRPLAWKLLLGYLPPNRKDWDETLRSNRELYYTFVQETMAPAPSSEHSLQDHPLSTEPSSAWKRYLEDNVILAQIDKDVRRTMPTMSFFQQVVSCPNAQLSNKGYGDILYHRLSMGGSGTSADPTNEIPILRDNENKVIDTHWQVIERILFVYARLNRGISYVQGMNDIIGPLYYVMANDDDLEWRANAEPDSFFCFLNLMSEIRDNFVKVMDNASTGIRATMNTLFKLLREKDFFLWNNLNAKGLHPQFFSFRWITLLMSQEFELPDVIRLWDSFLGDEYRFEFLIYCCCAMLTCAREQLLKGDFAENMSLLQQYPNIDLHVILTEAFRLREEDSKIGRRLRYYAMAPDDTSSSGGSHALADLVM